MEKAKEIVKKIILIHDANKLISKPDNIEELAKLIMSYQGESDRKDWKFKNPEDRSDSPHHHNNRLD